MNPAILDMDASTLAQKIKSGEITSLEAVNTYIDHINHINPLINAMVENRFHQAKIEAETCDIQLRNGEAEGRLFGVPISIKEALDVSGMKTTGGLVQRRDHIAQSDSEAVRRLRAEGAIVLGKTNTPSLCFCQETDNKLYGRTNNPWDLSKTAGGSSGGEGSLIAAGGAAVGVGSDIGGSIRFPSHFNGVIGFKPGKNTFSQQGHFPYVDHPLQERMLGIGALAKSVNDAELIHDILAEISTSDVESEHYTVHFLEKDYAFPIDIETRELYEAVKSHFSSRYTVRLKNPPHFEEMARIWQLVMSIDGGESVARMSVGSTGRAVLAYIKERLLRNSDTHHYLSWALIGSRLFKPSKKDIEDIVSFLDEADRQAEHYFNKAVLVMPVYHCAALPHGTQYKQMFSIKKTYLNYMPFITVANVLGLPALTVPVGTDQSGMPIGLQLVTTVGNEKALFFFGRELEKTFRGYVRSEYKTSLPS